MKLPLNQKLQSFLGHQPISFHVPGHKNMTIGSLNNIDLAMDITEITDFDDLHHPEEILKESMENIKKHPDYEAYFLVNGTTSGILSVIQAFSSPKPMLMSRNVHKSVFHGLDLANQNAEILPMDISERTYQYVTPKIEDALKLLDGKSLMITTYPNYYGETFDVKSLIEQSHQCHVPVLVDEAHGAHFGIAGFPKSSLNFGADYVVQSYHKTLPAFTMSSVLFIHKNAPNKDKVKQYLTYFQSSSPSYLLMAGLERAHQFYENYHADVFFQKRSTLMNALESKGLSVTEMDDPLKLTLEYKGYKGTELQEWLEAQYIMVELSNMKQVLLILPLWHEGDTFPFELLMDRIANLQLPKPKAPSDETINVQLPMEIGYYHPEKITQIKSVTIDQAYNRYLAEHIVPYPPGIPAYFKGEQVTESMVSLFQQWQEEGIRVEGINNQTIKVKDE